VYPYAAQAAVDLKTYGVVGAWAWKDLSLGLGIRYQVFSEEATTTRTDLDLPGTPSFVVSQAHGNRMFGQGSDSDVTYTAGVKWSPSRTFSAGAVFKKGAAACPLPSAPDGGAILRTRFTTEPV
jgi:long-subunit fatty acid transport protein